jgi:hypothetical protein
MGIRNGTHHYLVDLPVMGLVGYCLAKIKKNKFVGL